MPVTTNRTFKLTRYDDDNGLKTATIHATDIQLSDGVAKFYGDSGSIVAAYAPGTWLHVEEVTATAPKPKGSK